MISLDVSGLGPVAVALLVVLAVLLTALAGWANEAGWRKAAMRELELYRALREVADCPADEDAAATLKRSAVRRISRGATRGRRFGMGLLQAAAAAPFTTMAVILCAAVLAASAVGLGSVDAWRLVATLALCAAFDVVFLPFVRWLERRLARAEHGERKAHPEHGGGEEQEESEGEADDGVVSEHGVPPSVSGRAHGREGVSDG